MAVARNVGQFAGRRTATPDPRRFVYEPFCVGPRFEWLDSDRIRVLEGPKAGSIFGISTGMLDTSATVALYDRTRKVGSTAVDIVPSSRTASLWDVGVAHSLRRSGLATIMVWCAFRELLLAERAARFRIRMIRSLKADGDHPLQNIGMGVIAARFGFTPEMNVARVLAGENITNIDPIPPMNGYPPAVRLTLKTDPLVVIAFILNPDTLRPISDFRTYMDVKADDWQIVNWAREGLLCVNGNYCLRETGFNRFVNAVAVDHEEARQFRARLREP
uniref:Uncharacterized protein n=1 Tax=candidate division WOR-3 bacterium TaxID=2052148 RepID=A0A7C4CB17_UNCW3